MNKAEMEFGHELEAALEKYLAAVQSEENRGEVVADWVVGYTRQMIDDEGEVIWANSLINKHGGNPNAHAGLGTWLADATMGPLLEGIEED